MALLALKAVRCGNHPRAREAIRLLEDRLLSTGGCNYGNTIVLDQALLPHVEPTGAALMALAGEADRTGRIALSLDYLSAQRRVLTTTSCVAGLRICLAWPRTAGKASPPRLCRRWIAACTEQSYRRGASLELALLALAALGDEGPLISLPLAEQAA